ncbi:MAG: undecaprenyl-diphosphatase [Chthoniobacter sp.]|jgi:undecaprenyl-diphosphatase|nr:undecaprenyl-diphosphatase [Chthoniobacter sp.]
MNWWQALILGLVEGITEYLPVSSTGHLLLVQRLFGIGESEASDAFAICVQAGAIVAVLALYRQRVFEMWAGIRGNNPAGRKLATNLVAAFVPAAVLGFVLQKVVKKYLFGGNTWGLWPVVAAWFVGGVAILAVSVYRRRRQETDRPRFELDGLTVGMSLIIGVSQCLALWPGTSRSLVTIVGGILVGLRMRAAVEFSFLLGLLTLGAATAYDTLKHGREMLAVYGPLSLALGFLTAWLAAVVAVKWMVAYLNRHGLELFGYYRIGLALTVTAWLLLAAK